MISFFYVFLFFNQCFYFFLFAYPDQISAITTKNSIQKLKIHLLLLLLYQTQRYINKDFSCVCVSDNIFFVQKEALRWKAWAMPRVSCLYDNSILWFIVLFGIGTSEQGWLRDIIHRRQRVHWILSPRPEKERQCDTFWKGGRCLLTGSTLKNWRRRSLLTGNN